MADRADADAEAPAGRAGSQTVDRALGLLRALAAAPGEGLRLSDLADGAGLDRATAHRLLASLARQGFAEQDAASKRYRLGLEFFTLAAAASNRYDIAEVARAALERIAAETGDTATFCLRAGPDLVCVDVETGRFPIQALPLDIGSRRPLTTGAAGIAILATLPDSEIESVIGARAGRARIDRAALVDGIAAARREGWAAGPEEAEGRVAGIAVALINRRGRPQGTIGVTGLAERLSGGAAPAIAGLLEREARGIEEAMLRMREDNRHRASWARKASK